MATQEDIDKIDVVGRFNTALDRFMSDISSIDNDFKNLKVKIQFASSFRLDVESFRARSLEKIERRMKEWKKYDPYNKDALIVGPDFKYHTREELAIMLGHKLKG